MNIVIISHPSFLHSKSMPRFTNLLQDAFIDKGYNVEVLSPEPFIYRYAIKKDYRKWLGYIDQYILFPITLKKNINQYSCNTLFVIIDNALGPWVPLVSHKPHVIHCHDFIAQQSALDLIPEQKTSLTGKIYQKYIRRGYRQGRNFISVSNKTRQDLHKLLTHSPAISEVVYNGLNGDFKPGNVKAIRTELSQLFNVNLQEGYLLHVGGNQWYKNRIGVIELYDAWRRHHPDHNLPLLLIGETPSVALKQRKQASSFSKDIYFLTGFDNRTVQKAYVGASVFLFPSLMEGFGWPIAEAMASGCPVVTTDEAPMKEVAGDAGFMIPRMPVGEEARIAWADHAQGVIHNVLALSLEQLLSVRNQGIINAQRFDTTAFINQVEAIYKKIIANYL